MLSPPPQSLTSKSFAEFFAGIGLVREGLAASGWQCAYANDLDPKKQLTYQARFGDPGHFHRADVCNTAEILDRLPDRVALATASFPCIDLSLAGHYRGLGGEHSSAFFGFVEVLRALGARRPPLVLLENVVGFLSSRGGEDFKTSARVLADLGYWLDAFVLDACHFVPQSRPRVFVIGVSADVKLPPPHAPGWLWPCEEQNGLRSAALVRGTSGAKLATGWLRLPLPSPPHRSIDLESVLDLDENQEWWPADEVDRHYRMMSNLHRERVGGILASRKPWVGTIFRRIRQKQMRAEVRFDGLAGCLRTPKGGSAKQIVLAIDAGRLRMRWMSPREYARLQGTPDFPLVGTTIQQLWGFADAVCVPAIEWIDRHVLTPLFESSLAPTPSLSA